mmetsp:Transcript_118072/g.252251  ORF Transcript_118072/g.252251 Transcript_118072/m.252251 type:complete len:356 (+) Transcript_118072:1793-2860(+)
MSASSCFRDSIFALSCASFFSNFSVSSSIASCRSASVRPFFFFFFSSTSSTTTFSFLGLLFFSARACSKALLAARSSFSILRCFSSCLFNSSSASPLATISGTTEVSSSSCAILSIICFSFFSTFSFSFSSAFNSSRSSATRATCWSNWLCVSASVPDISCNFLFAVSSLTMTCWISGFTSSTFFTSTSCFTSSTTSGFACSARLALLSSSFACSDSFLMVSSCARSSLAFFSAASIAALFRLASSSWRLLASSSRAAVARSWRFSARAFFSCLSTSSAAPVSWVSTSFSTISVRSPSLTRSSTTSRMKSLVVLSSTNSRGSKNITGCSCKELMTNSACLLSVLCLSRCSLSSLK